MKPRSPYSKPVRTAKTAKIASATAGRETDAAAASVRISARAAARLRAGHCWVYRSDVVREPTTTPVSVVTVEDFRGKRIGTALYSSASQIALRMLSTELTAVDLPALVTARLREAIAYRREIVRNSDAYRVVFSEADFLPGLIVDRYNDLVVFQVLTQAMDVESVRAAMMQTLASELSPAAIIEKVDPRIRELEQLPPREQQVVYVAPGTEPRTSTVFTMNGIAFHFDGFSGQKTGAFLDQRENYAAAERFARGRALDVCTYQGGFALHLNRVCERVTAVDASRPALEIAEKNEQVNAAQFGGREIEWLEGNAFDVLRDYSDAGRQFESIVLDPPAFARTKKNLATAMHGYKELNLRALKMLSRGGTLVTCSCSFHVSEADFLEMLASAAADAHRRVRILEKRTQAADHPILLGMPESHYLKCIVASVD